MSNVYILNIEAETITFTTAFQKKLSKGDQAALEIYKAAKKDWPTFKVLVVEAKKRSGKYDHTSMDDIKAYLNNGEHDDWKAEFDLKFGEMIPSKSDATKSVRKVKFAVIRKWFIEKREAEEAAKTKKEHEAATSKAKRASKKTNDKETVPSVSLEVANSTVGENLPKAANE